MCIKATLFDSSASESSKDDERNIISMLACKVGARTEDTDTA